MAWSLITYGVCIMSFTWRANTTEDSTWYPLEQHRALIPRIIISILLGIGVIYLFLVVCAFESYGAVKMGSMKQIINDVYHPLHSAMIDNDTALGLPTESRFRDRRRHL
jgi:amino acid transporter